MKKKNIIKQILLIILISFFVEIFIFNFRSLQSIAYNKKILKDINVGNGVEKSGNKYTIVDNKDGYKK